MAKEKKTEQIGNTFLADYVGKGPEELKKFNFAQKLLAADDPGQRLKLYRQVKFYKLENKKGDLFYKDSAGNDKPYNNGQELKDLSDQYEKLKIDLAKKYGNKFFSTEVARSIDTSFGKHNTAVADVTGKEKIEAAIPKGRNVGYAKALETFQKAVNNVKELDTQLSTEKTYLYSTQISIKGESPTKENVIRAITDAVQEQQKITGIDHRTPEGFAKLKGINIESKKEVLLEFKNAQNELIKFKLNGKDFQNILKNLSPETLSNSQTPYRDLKREDVIALAGKLEKNLEGKLDIDFEKNRIKVSAPTKEELAAQKSLMPETPASDKFKLIKTADSSYTIRMDTEKSQPSLQEKQEAYKELLSRIDYKNTKEKDQLQEKLSKGVVLEFGKEGKEITHTIKLSGKEVIEDITKLKIQATKQHYQDTADIKTRPRADRGEIPPIPPAGREGMQQAPARPTTPVPSDLPLNRAEINKHNAPARPETSAPSTKPMEFQAEQNNTKQPPAIPPKPTGAKLEQMHNRIAELAAKTPDLQKSGNVLRRSGVMSKPAGEAHPPHAIAKTTESNKGGGRGGA